MMNTRSINDRYLESCQQEFWKKVYQFELEYLLEPLKGCRDVLSVGCGPAILESELTQRGYNVTGLDVSQEALSCAPDRVRTVTARAEDIPFPNNAFDAVTFVASLQFVDDYALALEQAARVLRGDGRIVVMLLNPASEFFKRKWNDPDSYVHQMKHAKLSDIEKAMAERFILRTEYCLGVRGEEIFESADEQFAALFILQGRKRASV